VARRRPRLTNIGSVLAELAYVYRKADAGRMAWADCAAASRILREVRHCLEASDIEARLAKLEAAAAEAAPDEPWPAPANGHSRHVPTH
jgi:hypothetical protein